MSSITPPVTLAVADPGDAYEIEAVATAANAALETAWESIQGEQPDVAAATRALVVAHEKVAALEAFGAAGAAAISGLRESMTVVEAQRDKAVKAADALQEEYNDLVENFTEAVGEQVGEMLMYEEQAWYEDLDTTQIANEEEGRMVMSIQQQVKFLRNEGAITEADLLETSLGTYLQARDAMADIRMACVTLLIEKSNERRRAVGVPEAQWYSPVLAGAIPHDLVEDDDDDYDDDDPTDDDDDDYDGDDIPDDEIDDDEIDDVADFDSAA